MAASREEENDSFRRFLRTKDDDAIDALVHRLNQDVSALVDCTSCGACCRTLMINVSKTEVAQVAAHLTIPVENFSDQYIEESQQGNLIMNTIPCHFLAENKCSVYTHRFAECREFPHLHRANFKDRLFGTLIHYAMCPIIFNVIERLKISTGFKTAT